MVSGRLHQPDDHGQVDLDVTEAGAGEPVDVQIARAIAARPPHVTAVARIVGVDTGGKRTVLRDGFPCQPGDLKGFGRPASCLNEAAVQWTSDLAARKYRPSNTEPGEVRSKCVCRLLAFAWPTGGPFNDNVEKELPWLLQGTP
jgi:hypothetical protein